MQYDLEREAERGESQRAAPAPEQRGDERQHLASAVGNSAMARAAQNGEQAPRGLVSGAPMSIARKAASDELEEAPGAAEATGGEHAEAAGGEAAGGEAPAPAAAEGAAPEAAPAPAAEAETAGELEEEK